MTSSNILLWALLSYCIGSALSWSNRSPLSRIHSSRQQLTVQLTVRGRGRVPRVHKGRHRIISPLASLEAVANENIDDITSPMNTNAFAFVGEKLIQWRGEKSHGNSMVFRHAEFKSALCTILNEEDLHIEYTKALSTSFDSSVEMSEYQIEAYQNAMQYVQVYQYVKDDTTEENTKVKVKVKVEIKNELWIKIVERCSLIRGLFEIVAKGDTYEELAQDALAQHSLDDMMPTGTNQNATWRVRLRQYGSTAASESKSKQYGKKMRSPMGQEREAVMKLKDILITLGGEVDLKHADVSIYILEGLINFHGHEGGKLLGRMLTKGGGGDDSDKATSTIAPKTRICVTNTPLAPIEAFTLGNLARIQNGDRVLDPFAGSCTTLLAASMLAPSSIQSVGIEIAHNGQVNRQHIVDDFSLRNLIKPAAIIRGDAMDQQIRMDAITAVGGQPFDCIVTDPPYGIREKTGYCADPPLVQLIKCIAEDRDNDRRLLKKSGRLVAFVPNVKGEDVMLGMPSTDEVQNAGLEFVQMLEQPLNDSLSRWLVEYKCIR